MLKYSSDYTLNLYVELYKSMDHPSTQCHTVLCHNPKSLDRHDLLQHKATTKATATLYSTYNTSELQGSNKMTQE